MKIQLVRNEGCHIWQTAEKTLNEALSEAKLPQDYEIIVVKSNEKARKQKFFGSPQITIDGRDIDPKAEKIDSFQVEGCRFYIWKGKMHEYPPKEMILHSFKAAI